MIDNAFELVTQTMERQYPDHVAFRYVAADGETVVEKTYAQYVQDIRRVVTYLRQRLWHHPGGWRGRDPEPEKDLAGAGI